MKIKKGFYRAITTKFIGATDRLGARVKAIDGGNCVIVPWKYALSPQENHFNAVKALCEKYKLDWGENWGATQGWNQNGYCFFPLENGYSVD